MSVKKTRTGSARGSLDGESLDPTCPECGATISMTVGEARQSPTRTCPNGHEISFASSSLDRGIKDIERKLDNLF
jgi:hypothetical protein